VRFAYEKGIAGRGGKRVKVQLTPPGEPVEKVLELEGKKLEGVFINTGVPHFVVPVEDVDKVNVVKLGRAIRFHEEFQPKGTNVSRRERTP